MMRRKPHLLFIPAVFVRSSVAVISDSMLSRPLGRTATSYLTSQPVAFWRKGDTHGPSSTRPAKPSSGLLVEGKSYPRELYGPGVCGAGREVEPADPIRHVWISGVSAR